MFNGQNSVMWCNLRDAFSTEIRTMYQQLRSQGRLSYALVEAMFEEHQGKWPEAIFNEDAWFKYIDPLTQDGSGAYLAMAQGSKAEQRKWWLYNRYRYMDSKWLAGDALSDVIQLRGYAKANITVTPYADIYPSVKYGSYLVTERGSHGAPTTLVCPLDAVNDTEIYVYSASQLASVGDLSGLKVGFADFSMATKLQSIKVGDGSAVYENPNLTVLSVGNNALLQSVDARNCSALAGTIDLSGAPNLKEAKFTGTSVASVVLPVGGTMRTLALPATVTNLTVRGQSGITSFAMEDYSHITTLRVEDCGTAVPVVDILADMPASSRVRVIGLTHTVSTTTEVEELFDLLDTMRGLDEQGGNVETAQVSGIITGLGSVTGAWLARMQPRYPDLVISYEHVTSNLRYYSWDGQTLLHTETVSDGGDGTWATEPTRDSTAQYTYEFLGWSTETDAHVADPTATEAVTMDRDVYAAYSASVRTYTVTWKDWDNTVLETDTDVPYGTTPTYDGATPTKDGRPATGWEPAVSAVTGNATYTATYVRVFTLSYYSQDGQTLLHTEDVVEGQSGTWAGTPEKADTAQYDYTFVGWATSANATAATSGARSNVAANRSVYAAFSETLRTYTVTWKNEGGATLETDTNVPYGTTPTYDGQTPTHDGATSAGWTPSVAPVTGDATYTATYPTWTVRFYNGSTLLDTVGVKNGKTAVYTGSTPQHPTDPTGYEFSGWSPSNANVTADTDCYAQFEAVVTNAWDEIIAAVEDGTASTKYSVGDEFPLDLGTEGTVNMVLVAKGADPLASGGGNAALTFVSKELLNTSHNMNASSTTSGGWTASGMRSYLTGTIAPLIPSNLMSAIKEVTKYSGHYENGAISKDHSSTDKLWIPSHREVFGESTYETQGPVYTSVFDSAASRVKHKANAASGSGWWLRSANGGGNFRTVNYDGNADYNNAYSTYGVALGFSL